MKSKWMAILIVGLVASPVGADDSTVLTTRAEQRSYSLGVNVIRNFIQQGIELDLETMVKGMRDALSGGKLLMTELDMRITMAELQNELKQKQVDFRQTVRKGYAFLDENKKKEGVVALASGLQYKVLATGNGRKPTDADTVEVRYRATYVDGSEFDSSGPGQQPVALKVGGGALPGAGEALKLMPVGSKWRLFIPPHLAYGELHGKQAIRPSEVLIYEVELVAIE